MKHLITSLFIASLLLSCGNEENKVEQKQEKVQESKDAKEWKQISVNDGGFVFDINIPSKEIAGGEGEVTYLEDMGELEIRVGNTFDLLIFEDESQIEMMRNEVSNHPFFKVEMVVDNDSSLLYRYYTEDGNTEQWHTYIERKYGDSKLLIRSNDGEEFSEYESKKMLEAALSISTSN